MTKPGQGTTGPQAQPRFAHTALRTGLVYLLVPLTAFLTGPVLARALGPDDRGLLAGVLAPLALSTLLLSFGLPEASTYFAARWRGNPRWLALAAGGAGFVTGVLALVCMHLYAAWVIADPTAQDLVRALSWVLPAVMGVAGLRSVLMGAGRFSVVNLERGVGALARLAVVVALAVGGALTVTTAAWATEGVFLAVAVAILVPSAVRLCRSGPPAPRAVRIPELAYYGLRVWPGVVAGVVLLRADQTLMLPLAGARELGFYAVAVAVAEVLNLGVIALRDVLLPTVSRDWSIDALGRACRCFVILMVPAIAVSLLVVPVGLPLLYGAEFREAVVMAQILCLSALPFGLSLLLGVGLMASGKPGLTSLIQGLSALFALIGLVVLLPSYGGVGAAAVSLVSYTAGASISTVVCIRVLGSTARALLSPRWSDVRFLATALRRH